MYLVDNILENKFWAVPLLSEVFQSYMKVSYRILLTFNIQVSLYIAPSTVKSFKLTFPNMWYVSVLSASRMCWGWVMHGSEQLGVLVRAEVICGHLSQDPCLQGQTTQWPHTTAVLLLWLGCCCCCSDIRPASVWVAGARWLEQSNMIWWIKPEPSETLLFPIKELLKVLMCAN